MVPIDKRLFYILLRLYMNILDVNNLIFRYPNADHDALSSVSFSVKKGELLCITGPTGSGKSTLLKCIKRELTPLGVMSGDIMINGKDINDKSLKESASETGYVCQFPEQQIVCDKVWHELAFGLENLGTPQNVMRRRIAEIASFFGIDGLFDKNTSELSGGQKQLLNLASVMVMEPDILLLDEPVSQLDPLAASGFLREIVRLNRDLGTTVIISEHCTEEILPFADRLMIVENGGITHIGTPRAVAGEIGKDDRLMQAMPAAARLYAMLGSGASCPLSVKEGHEYILENYNADVKKNQNGKDLKDHPLSSPALEFSEVFMHYDKTGPDVLHDLTFKVYENEIMCLLGGNGSGKTTLLSVAAALNKPYSGTVKLFGKKLKDYKKQELRSGLISYLPQDVQTVFLHNTVREELDGSDISSFPFDLTRFFDRHPYDLSGGEQEILALAVVLKSKAKLLLADEPTKGLDPASKLVLADIFKKLKESGVTILTVTHDTEFAALVSDRCALLFRGEIMSTDVPDIFFNENRFYTTPAARMARGVYENAVTVEKIAEFCRLNGSKKAGGLTQGKNNE